MPTEILKKYFGYDDFREGQAEIIDAIMNGRDILGVMPTGAGKSLCYQVPALLLKGVTIVVSPLISLMRDQVLSLAANGVPAAFINSSLSDRQFSKAMANARNGVYKLIYAAPERLLTPSMLNLAQTLEISLVAVDEAHCISAWGQDFRPSYLDIPRFVESLPKRSVVAAFTATATPRVREDILHTLELREPLAVTTGFDRPNLYFEVQRPKDKFSALKRFLSGHDGNGVVYCSTRKEVESVTEKLRLAGISAVRYHAGLSDSERGKAQDDFLFDRAQIIVATNAFGMGIDKSDVRFVIHYNMPQNLESYYQEAGRAGRDGLPGDCVIFYARRDINTALYLINQSDNDEEKARNCQLLNQMERYCETDGCLRRFILEYFGEHTVEDCGNCSNCKGEFEKIDATVDAQKILSCIARINKNRHRFGFGALNKVLTGKADEYIASRELDKLSTFGIMKGYKAVYIRRLFDKLVSSDYVAVSNDQYHTVSLTEKAREILTGGAKIMIRAAKPQEAEKTVIKSVVPESGISEDLLSKLKRLRREIANANKIPAYIVFSDATLADMCRKHPRTEWEFLKVSGVGQVKLERYGAQFLQLLNAEPPSGAPPKTKYSLTAEILVIMMAREDTPVSILHLADIINEVLDKYSDKKTSGAALTRMLKKFGYVEVAENTEQPTAKGREIGIMMREMGEQSHQRCVYNTDAQEFIAAMFMRYR